jgi:hypothetical protein
MQEMDTVTITTKSGSRYRLVTLEGEEYVTRLSEIPLHSWSGKALDDVVVGERIERRGELAIGAPFRFTVAAGPVISTPVVSID